MEKKFKLGVIGGGFMSQSIVSGVINSKTLDKEKIIVSDLNEVALNKLNSMGVFTTNNNDDVLEKSEFILFAVKPQSLTSVAESVNKYSDLKLISIMAGVKKQRLKDIFQGSLVARAMPNTPCSLGSGAVGLDISDYKNENDVAFIKSIFDSIATVALLPETKLNAVTGISGSSPAYFYLFIKSLVEAGVANGLEEIEAKKLAVATMKGSADMILSNADKSLDDLITAVCSKGGTTIEAMKVFEESKIADIVREAVNACVKRATELENS